MQRIEQRCLRTEALQESLAMRTVSDQIIRNKCCPLLEKAVHTAKRIFVCVSHHFISADFPAFSSNDLRCQWEFRQVSRISLLLGTAGIHQMQSDTHQIQRTRIWTQACKIPLVCVRVCLNLWIALWIKINCYVVRSIQFPLTHSVPINQGAEI